MGGDDDTTTWRRMIEAAMSEAGDAWKNLISCTLSDADLDIEFDAGYGGTNGKPFTAWTENFVYFPVCYDGAEWCGFVPRNPNGVATHHQGSG